MKFKVSTKEKFTTITVNEANIYAKLTDNLSEICLPYLTQNVKNIILQIKDVETVDEDAANAIAKLQPWMQYRFHNFLHGKKSQSWKLSSDQWCLTSARFHQVSR